MGDANDRPGLTPAGAGGREREACRATPDSPAEGTAEGAGSAWHVGFYRW